MGVLFLALCRLSSSDFVGLFVGVALEESGIRVCWLPFGSVVCLLCALKEGHVILEFGMVGVEELRLE